MAADRNAKAKALELIRRGFTREETARKVKVSERTVYRWVRDAEHAELAANAPAVVPPKPDALAPAPRPSAAAGARAEEITRHSVDSALAMAERALADGNTTAAAKLIRDALSGSNTLARIESRQRENEDVVTIPRVELERAKQAMRDRVAALASDIARTGGLVCSNCGRDLRIRLAQGDS